MGIVVGFFVGSRVVGFFVGVVVGSLVGSSVVGLAVVGDSVWISVAEVVFAGYFFPRKKTKPSKRTTNMGRGNKPSHSYSMLPIMNQNWY